MRAVSGGQMVLRLSSLMLAMVFVSMLLLAIAMTVIGIMHLYQGSDNEEGKSGRARCCS